VGDGEADAVVIGLSTIDYRLSTIDYRLSGYFIESPGCRGIGIESSEPRMKQTVRHIIGLAIQPFLAGAIAFVFFPMFLLDGSGRTFEGGYGDSDEAALSVAAGVFLLAAFVTIGGVFPVTLWRVRQGRVRLGEAMLWGFGFGNLPLAVGAALAGGLQGGPSHWLALATFASLIGTLCAAAYWLIACRGDGRAEIAAAS
jgi:hypothetical protein